MRFNYKIITRVVLVFFILLWISFIFSNSLKNAEDSTSQSDVIVDFVTEIFFGQDNSSLDESDISLITIVVRKLAHFSEFAILSALIFSLLITFNIRRKFLILLPSLSTLFIASIDEFLQIFSDGRSCSIFDVMIDVSGGIVAVLILFVIYNNTFLRYGHE